MKNILDYAIKHSTMATASALEIIFNHKETAVDVLIEYKL